MLTPTFHVVTRAVFITVFVDLPLIIAFVFHVEIDLLTALVNHRRRPLVSYSASLVHPWSLGNLLYDTYNLSRPLYDRRLHHSSFLKGVYQSSHGRRTLESLYVFVYDFLREWFHALEKAFV